MKCVSIVYKRPTSQNLTPELVPVRSVKRSVDEYLEKLKEKQEQQKFMLKNETKFIRSQLKTVQTARQSRIVHQEMPDFINVCKMKYSTENIFKQDANPEFFNEGKQKKFRSTFVKKKQFKGSYSLKGIKTLNQGLFDEGKVKSLQNKITEGTKNFSRLINLKKLKLSKPNTILISVDFILNEHNFWQEERIDETAHKNWKLLQQHSNIVWLTKRQNSSKKLQKYATDYGLRLDGVYKIMSSKKGHTLMVSLGTFEKDFRMQSEVLKFKELKREVIVINSLKVDQIRDVKYEQFYNSFLVAKSMRCVVHFIQIDMQDKHRFNSPLKILSKENLPSPNSVAHLFSKFYKDQSSNNPEQMIQSYMMDLNSIEPEQEETISKQQMMTKYEELKEEFVNYFGNHLKISMNKKLKIEESECSVQFMIGDMLKRNFNIMYGYQKQCIKIKNRLGKIMVKQVHSVNQDAEQDEKKNNNSFLKNKTQRVNYDELIKSKLFDESESKQNVFKRTKQPDNNFYYKDPVFLWKK